MDHNIAGTRTVSGALLPVVHSAQVTEADVIGQKQMVQVCDYCRDDRARLRWRIAKHPEHQKTWVLRPCSGRLLIRTGSVYRGYTVP